MAEEHGTGAIQSPPDERDLILDESKAAAASRLAGATAAASLSSFRIGNRPPVLDQGVTPQCVSYSSSVDQNWQDRVDHGRFFNFSESRFFSNIGGTWAGAIMRVALEERLRDGIPEEGTTPSAAKHQIAAYALVTKSAFAIKNAIASMGGVLVIGPWYDNWTNGLGSLAILPRPMGGSSGHAFWAIGWDEYGMVAQNSWGTAWGDGGLFRMRWEYVVGYMWEVWSTVDERTVAAVARGRIKDLGINIYRLAMVTSDKKPELSRAKWGETRKNGIRRERDGAIVATPWDRAFRFGGWVGGVRHGLEPYPFQYGKLFIHGRWRAVPRPMVRLV